MTRSLTESSHTISDDILESKEHTNQATPFDSFSATTVQSFNQELESHPALTWDLNSEQRELYITSFALLAETAPMDTNGEKTFTISNKQKEFLVALCKKFECHTVLSEFDNLCKNPHRIDIKSLNDLLNNKEKQYTWLLDMILLDSLKDNSESKQELFKNFLIMFNLPNDHDFIEKAQRFVIATDSVELGEAILPIARLTDGYKHILKFRCVSMQGAYFNFYRDLMSAGMRINCRILSQDLSFMLSMPLYIVKTTKKSKTKCEKRLMKNKNEILQLLEKNKNPFRNAESILYAFGIKNIEYSSFSEIFCQLERQNFKINIAIDDDDEWEEIINKLRESLMQVDEKIRNLKDICMDQLTYFEKGKFESAHQDKQRAIEERKRKEEEERKANESIDILIEGQKKHVQIEWKDIDITSLPFKPHTIQYAASDGIQWLLVTTNSPNELYHSPDGEKWLQYDSIPTEDRFKKLEYINGTWLARTREVLYYSENMEKWYEMCFAYDDQLFHDGTDWIRITHERVDYIYIEPGFFRDSKQTSSYEKPTVYRAKSLSSEWHLWEEASNLKPGYVFYGNIACLDGVHVVAIGYYSYYADNKNIPYTGFSLNYFNHKSSWQPCNIYEDFDKNWNCRDTQIISWKQSLLVKTRNQIFSSQDTLNWVVSKCDYTPNYTHLTGMQDLLMVLPNHNDNINISADGVTFSSLMLEKGEWRTMGTNNNTILAVFSPNENKYILRIGKVIVSDIE